MSTDPKRYEELEEAIDAGVASYDTEDDINNLESAALPNKRAVVQAYDHIKPALYLGFYSARSLDRRNLRHSVAEHLYAAYEILVAQIERAIHYEHWHGRDTAGTTPALPELRRVLNLDVIAAFEGDPAAQSVEAVVFSYPSIEAITAYRVAHLLHRAHVPMIPRIITEHAHSQTGIDINPGARIGERFFIDHGTGVVIGETSVIGDNVKIYQGVTLGALSVPHRLSKGDQRHPTIEDGVTIYSGATILGGETVIGRGSVIGGNVWLVRSTPPDAKVFGRSRDPGDVNGDGGAGAG